MADVIYRDMLRFRQTPADLFTVSPQTVNAILGSLQALPGVDRQP